MGDFSLDLNKSKKIINHLSDIGVFHVVLSGGEPRCLIITHWLMQ